MIKKYVKLALVATLFLAAGLSTGYFCSGNIANAQTHGAEELRVVVYPDRFPNPDGPNDATVAGQRRDVGVFVSLSGDWPNPPTLKLIRDDARIAGVTESDNVELASQAVTTGEFNLPATVVRATQMHDYMTVYAELSGDDVTIKSDRVTIEWRGEPPIADLEGIIQTSRIGPGVSNVAAILLPLLLGAGAVFATRNPIVGAATYFLVFAAAAVFLDVSIYLIVFNILAALGVTAIFAMMVLGRR